MSRLDAASERLERTLQDLELACEPLAQSRRLLGEAEERSAALQRERTELLARVAELEEQVKTIARLNEEAESRVDGAIAQIRASLGR